MGRIHLDNEGKIIAIQSQIRILRNFLWIRCVMRIHEYLSMNDMEQAEQNYRRSVALMPERMNGVYDITLAGTWYRLLEILVVCQKAEEREVLEIYSQAIHRWPEKAD